MKRTAHQPRAGWKAPQSVAGESARATAGSVAQRATGSQRFPMPSSRRCPLNARRAQPPLCYRHPARAMILRPAGAAMRRREFITLLGGAAAMWPLAAPAQQPDRIRRIGVLMGIAADDPESPVRIAAFLDRLRQLGWTDGLNVQIDTRWSAADANRARDYAAELIASGPDVLL